MALVLDVPFVGVNHLEAHLYAAMLDDPNMKGVEQITLSYTFHRAEDRVNPAASGTN